MRTCTFFQFATEDGLRQSVIIRAQYMVIPAKLSSNQKLLEATRTRVSLRARAMLVIVSRDFSANESSICNP